MPTIVGTPQKGLESAFGASPRSTTITAPTSGNSLALIVATGANVALDSLSCGNGTATRLYSYTRVNGGAVIEFWIVTNITNSPTTVVGAWTGSNNVLYVDKVEFAGIIEQHNTQEGGVDGSGDTSLGPSLTSISSSVGAIGDVYFTASRTLTAATGLSTLPGSSTTSHMVYSDNLGAAGSYVIGGTPDIFANYDIAGVLLQDAGGGGGPVIPVIAAGLQRMMNN
jgi:hypothetical protein